MQNNILTIGDVFTEETVVDFFTLMQYSTEAWDSLSIEAIAYMYLFNNSDRIISPLTERAYSRFGEKEWFGYLAQLITATYGETFTKLYNAMFANYNPINNYEMVENGEDTRTLNDTSSDSSNSTFSESSEVDTTTTSTVDETVTTLKSAFNSSSPITDGMHKTDNSTEGGEKNNRTQSGDSETKGSTDRNVTETSTHTFSRSGNIGVTTSAQMIEGEIELRKKEYWDIIFQKINSLITLSIY